ncbi:hypothetical protein ACTFIV_010327 [Dictyostelium citrinum]
MNSIKIKCKESISSFGSFPKDYHPQLQGSLSPTEFESIIDRINNACKSSFNKGFLFFFFGPIAGIALIIVGIIRWRKLVEERDKVLDWRFNNNDFYINGDDVYSYYMNPKNKDAYKPDRPFFYFVIGIALFLVGCVLFCCFYLAFKRKILGKIENELIPINSMYSQRMISFKMEDENEREYIPDYEFRVHRNNQAYMNGVKFDTNGNPYRDIEVHYLYITFPLNAIQNQPPNQPPMYSITPGIQTNPHDNQMVEMNVMYV